MDSLTKAHFFDTSDDGLYDSVASHMKLQKKCHHQWRSYTTHCSMEPQLPNTRCGCQTACPPITVASARTKRISCWESLTHVLLTPLMTRSCMSPLEVSSAMFEGVYRHSAVPRRCASCHLKFEKSLNEEVRRDVSAASRDCYVPC